eukprot:PhF_6_TR23928/c0_g1_i2/m.33489
MSGSQVFLRVLDGKTLWLPGHQAQPGEPTTPAALLTNCPPAELNMALVLFDGPVTIVSNRNEASLSLNAKTHDDVQVAVAEFRKRCLSDGTFMQSRRYTPQQLAAPVQHPYPMGGADSSSSYGNAGMRSSGMMAYPNPSVTVGGSVPAPAIMGNFSGGFNTNSNYGGVAMMPQPTMMGSGGYGMATQDMGMGYDMGGGASHPPTYPGADMYGGSLLGGYNAG